MPKKKIKPFRKLSFEEKVDLELEGSGTARQEFRKRKKAGRVKKVADVVKEKPVPVVDSEAQEVEPTIDVAATEQAEVRNTFGVNAGVDEYGIPKTPQDEADEGRGVAEALVDAGREREIKENYDREVYGIEPEVDVNEQEIAEKEAIVEQSKGIDAIQDLLNNKEPSEDIQQEMMKNITTEDLSYLGEDIVDKWLAGEDEIAKMMINQYKSAVNAAIGGEPAIEKLGIQDYYPYYNQPLRVGAYKGSIVGEVGIYVAGGGLIPVGVMDARKRALEAAAKKKAKNDEEITKLLRFSTAAQWQDQYSAMQMDLLEKFRKDTNNDFSKANDMSLGLSRKFWEDTWQLKALGEKFDKADKEITKILTDGNEAGRILPTPIMAAITSFKVGQGNLKEYLGNKDKFAKDYGIIRSYASLTTHLDKAIVNMKMMEIPLKAIADFDIFKADGKTIDEVKARNIKEAFNTSSYGDYDSIASATLSFIKPEYLEDILDVVLDPNTGGDFYLNPDIPIDEARKEQRELAKKYIAGKLAPQLKTKIQNIGTTPEWKKIIAWGRHNRAEKKLILTDAYKKSKEAQPLLVAAFANNDTKARGEAYKEIEAESSKWNPVVDKNGELVNGELTSELKLSPDEKKAIRYVRVGDYVHYNNNKGTDGKPIGFQTHSARKNYIVNRAKEGKPLSKDDQYWIIHYRDPDAEATTTASGVRKSPSIQNDDGSFTAITTRGSQRDMQDAAQVFEFTYTPQVIEEVTKKGEKTIEKKIILGAMRRKVDGEDSGSISLHENAIVGSAQGEFDIIERGRDNGGGDTESFD